MIRKIEIQPVLNGFVVTAGCTVVVFESVEKLTTELRSYLTDPDAVEKQYQTESINANKLGLVAQAECDGPLTGSAAGAVIGAGRLGGLRETLAALREERAVRRDPGNPAGSAPEDVIRCRGEKAATPSSPEQR